MDESPFGLTPYSSEIDLWLTCPFGRVALSQVGSSFVIAASSHNIPPCKAEVTISIDGREHSRQVDLVHGISPDNPISTVLALDAIPF
jgi:hypothetical protein